MVPTLLHEGTEGNTDASRWAKGRWVGILSDPRGVAPSSSPLHGTEWAGAPLGVQLGVWCACVCLCMVGAYAICVYGVVRVYPVRVWCVVRCVCLCVRCAVCGVCVYLCVFSVGVVCVSARAVCTEDVCVSVGECVVGRSPGGEWPGRGVPVSTRGTCGPESLPEAAAGSRASGPSWEGGAPAWRLLCRGQGHSAHRPA